MNEGVQAKRKEKVCQSEVKKKMEIAEKNERIQVETSKKKEEKGGRIADNNG